MLVREVDYQLWKQREKEKEVKKEGYCVRKERDKHRKKVSTSRVIGVIKFSYHD